MSIRDILNIEGEDDFFAAISREEMVSAVVDANAEDRGSRESEGKDNVLPGSKEQINSLSLAKRIAEVMSVQDSAFIGCLNCLQRDVRSEVRCPSTQSTVDMLLTNRNISNLLAIIASLYNRNAPL